MSVRLKEASSFRFPPKGATTIQFKRGEFQPASAAGVPTLSRLIIAR
jgi:hypothetical protein